MDIKEFDWTEDWEEIDDDFHQYKIGDKFSVLNDDYTILDIERNISTCDWILIRCHSDNWKYKLRLKNFERDIKKGIIRFIID